MRVLRWIPLMVAVAAVGAGWSTGGSPAGAASPAPGAAASAGANPEPKAAPASPDGKSEGKSPAKSDPKDGKDAKPADPKAPAKKAPAAKKPATPRPPPVVITDETAAGPDILVQGEYVGEAAGAKWAAQIVARHEGKFDAVLLAGGLPGEGWDGKTRLTTALTTDAATKVVSGMGKEFDARIADGKLAVRLRTDPAKPATEIALSRVVRRSPTQGAKPPAGAIVLFDGTGTDEWKNAKTVDLPDGKCLVAGTSSVRTFRDCTLHMEFRLIFMPRDRGNRSNSGVFLDDYYEVQILDSFGVMPEKHGCAAMYTYFPPDVNVCLPPFQWQTYDIDFTAPRFDAEGKKTSNARITVRHNGVVVHDNREYPKGTNLRPDGKPAGGAIHLQNHGSPVLYRNIWVVDKSPAPAPAAVPAPSAAPAPGK